MKLFIVTLLFLLFSVASFADHADYYQVLGVTKNSSLEQITTAYRKLAMKYHPDRNDDPKAAEKFILIKDAYNAITKSFVEGPNPSGISLAGQDEAFFKYIAERYPYLFGENFNFADVNSYEEIRTKINVNKKMAYSAMLEVPTLGSKEVMTDFNLFLSNMITTMNQINVENSQDKTGLMSPADIKADAILVDHALSVKGYNAIAFEILLKLNKPQTEQILDFYIDNLATLQVYYGSEQHVHKAYQGLAAALNSRHHQHWAFKKVYKALKRPDLTTDGLELITTNLYYNDEILTKYQKEIVEFLETKEFKKKYKLWEKILDLCKTESNSKYVLERILTDKKNGLAGQLGYALRLLKLDPESKISRKALRDIHYNNRGSHNGSLQEQSFIAGSELIRLNPANKEVMNYLLQQPLEQLPKEVLVTLLKYNPQNDELVNRAQNEIRRDEPQMNKIKYSFSYYMLQVLQHDLVHSKVLDAIEHDLLEKESTMSKQPEYQSALAMLQEARKKQIRTGASHLRCNNVF